jgi:Mrp family chromosome partitioning ATPase
VTGTSDEHITVVESLRDFKPDGAILVTTPQVSWKILKSSSLNVQLKFFLFLSLQAVSVNDVRRELSFCRKTDVPILGIIENMSGFICPHCSVSVGNQYSYYIIGIGRLKTLKIRVNNSTDKKYILNPPV